MSNYVDTTHIEKYLKNPGFKLLIEHFGCENAPDILLYWILDWACETATIVYGNSSKHKMSLTQFLEFRRGF